MNNDIISFLQGMSNSAAGTVTAPVDGLAWLLRKAGVPVPAAPVGGSDWMEQKGLLAQPKNRNAGLLGEAIGGVAPIVAAAKAPQIARGLLQMGDNISAPSDMARQGQRGMILYHGTGHPSPIKEVGRAKDGVVDGVFTSPSKTAAEAHGDAVYRFTVPDEKIAPHDLGDIGDLPAVSKLLKQRVKGKDRDKIIDAILSDKEIVMRQDADISAIARALPGARTPEPADLSWEMQNLRGAIARQAGFDAVPMRDEHGLSYLIPPGGPRPRPYNADAKRLFAPEKYPAPTPPAPKEFAPVVTNYGDQVPLDIKNMVGKGPLAMMSKQQKERVKELMELRRQGLI